MTAEAVQATDMVLNAPLHGLNDIINREQVIGEVRGLRRLHAEVETMRQEIIEELKEEDGTPTE